VGSWAVTYKDRALEDVKGTATVKQVDGKLRAKVVLTDPNSGRRELRSFDIIEEGERFTLLLEGAPPSAEGLSPDRLEALPGLPITTSDPADAVEYSGVGAKDGRRPTPLNSLRVELPDTADKILVTVGDFNGEIAVPRHGPVDTDRVRLQLTYEAPDASSGVTSERFVGFWSFDADPVTRRDGAGRGRIGMFVRDKFNPNFTGQVGNETWIRTIPPVKIRLFALTVGDLKRIDRLYGGVPTVIEAVFDDPQADTTKDLTVTVDGRDLKLTANRDPQDYRRFVTDIIVPTTPSRSAGGESP
jgi:hypothetical protein